MVTLDRLINVLGGYGVRLLTPAHGSCPAPRSTELRSVVMHEPGRVVGDVLLAVGADSIAEAVQWAEAARAVVVLVRGPHSPADGEDLTAGVGVAVMTVEPEVSWSELAAVVYGVVLEGRETESGRGPTDLFALADSLADAVGGAVTIEDRRSAVLAYSRLQQHADPARAETILSRGAPERLRALFETRGVFRHLAESDEPMFVEGDDDRGLTGRMVVAARAGRELLGSIWVTCAAPLPDARRAALADGARMVALHLLRSRASADLERQVESELVIRLLEGAADATTAASRLGLPQTPLRVIALRARTGDERHAPLLLAFERATAGFGWSRPGRSALAGNTVYTVLPGAEAEAASGWVAGLRAALPEPVTVLAGISGPATAAELATSAWPCTRSATAMTSATTSGCRSTTRPGMRSCCSGCGSPPAPAAPRSGDRSQSCGPTTRPTALSTRRRCGPGWRRRATWSKPGARSVFTRTPCATGCARWSS